MRDPFNPTPDEIREWASTKGAMEPEQDWDLHLAKLRYLDLYVSLAADQSCPSWDYFLRVLYLIVGDAVRSAFRAESRKSIEELLQMTERYPQHYFRVLRERSAKLLLDPNIFNYDDWCAGGMLQSI